MPRPIDPGKRAAILADIQAGAKARNEIARDHGVSGSTVTKIAKDEGIASAFDRAQTVKGTRAKQADNSAKRAQLQSDLLDDAQRFRARAWSTYKIPLSGPEGIEIVELDEPPLPDAARAYTAIGIIIDKDRAYERDKSGSDGTDHAKSMLGQLMAGLAEAFGDEAATPEDS
jgi:hypothetical protein